MTAARSAGVPLVELRYEELAADPAAVARRGSPPSSGSDAGRSPTALSRVHDSSVGRYRSDLTDEQLADVEDEAGALLRELGYVELGHVSSASA